ncbi:MAG: HAD hydrolase family protein [Candidatus Omnitrophica bacterium]|nr:HAD hydrolase family protein [Candidatus Omnitrophota bacterium]
MNNYSPELIEKARKIKLLLLDVDGVLTDGRLTYSSKGAESKHFDVNDGFGMYLVKQSGIKCIILTAKASRAVAKRAKELKLDKVYQNFHFKIEALEKIRQEFDMKDEEICFIGDELIDIPVLKRVGLAICPPNAVEEAKRHAHFITERSGGRGAVREVCNFLLKTQGKWDEVTKRYFE